MLRALLFVSLLSVVSLTQAAGDRLLIWEVQTARAKTWLLGSVHLARPDMYPLRAEIMQAFDSADNLVVEVDIGGGNQLAIQQQMLAMGSYPPGKTIRDDLSASTWAKLEKALQASGLPPMMMEGLKPGLVVTTLTTMELMKLGLNPELGIDKYFLTQARGRKPIIELETVEQQISLLLDFPNQDLVVRQTLYQLDSLESSMDRLLRYWKQGDAQGLRKLVIDDELARHPEFRPLQKRMFDDRNRAMTHRIVELQQRGGSYFVVVGAGHLLGDQGIIEMLKRRGQKPRQL